MTPITTSIVPLVALFLGSATAFVTPAGRRWPAAPNAQAASALPVSASITRCRSSSTALKMATNDASDTAEQRAQKLRDAAAAMRAQAAELEEKQRRERREGADKSFLAFDSDKDGAVGIAELRAGLEGPLKKTFAASLTARMGRKPTPDEVRSLLYSMYVPYSRCVDACIVAILQVELNQLVSRPPLTPLGCPDCLLRVVGTILFVRRCCRLLLCRVRSFRGHQARSCSVCMLKPNCRYLGQRTYPACGATSSSSSRQDNIPPLATIMSSPSGQI